MYVYLFGFRRKIVRIHYSRFGITRGAVFFVSFFLCCFIWKPVLKLMERSECHFSLKRSKRVTCVRRTARTGNDLEKNQFVKLFLAHIRSETISMECFFLGLLLLLVLHLFSTVKAHRERRLVVVVFSHSLARSFIHFYRGQKKKRKIGNRRQSNRSRIRNEPRWTECETE